LSQRKGYTGVLSAAFLQGVFREVRQEILDAEQSVSFVLDEELRLRYCNPAWDRFAEHNGAPYLSGEKVLGRFVLASTSVDLAAFYGTLYTDVLRDGRSRSHNFQCSSPDMQRLMRMNVLSLKTAGAVLVSCSIRVEQPHSDPSSEPVEERYRGAKGLIVMCSNCRKTRRADVRPEVWDWVPQFVVRQPSMVSHGICNLCLGYYYPTGI
jgi:hypothetical protein